MQLQYDLLLADFARLHLTGPENVKPVMRYSMIADAFYWTDELPDEWPNPEMELCFRLLLRYRTTLILDRPDKSLSAIWHAARVAIPDWVGFSAERCNPSSELQSAYSVADREATERFLAGIDDEEARIEARRIMYEDLEPTRARYRET